MNATITPLFPQLVYICDEVGLSFHKEIIDCVNQYDGEYYKNPLLNVNSTKGKTNLISSSPFKELCNEVLFHMKSFAENLGYRKERCDSLFINDCWFNSSDKGEYVYPHTHPGSFLSAAYYVKTNEENVFTLYNPNNLSAMENPSYPISENAAEVNINCVPGRLIIFFSNFMHSTPVQKNEGQKIVLSFNSIFENKK